MANIQTPQLDQEGKHGFYSFCHLFHGQCYNNAWCIAHQGHGNKDGDKDEHGDKDGCALPPPQVQAPPAAAVYTPPVASAASPSVAAGAQLHFQTGLVLQEWMQWCPQHACVTHAALLMGI